MDDALVQQAYDRTQRYLNKESLTDRGIRHCFRGPLIETATAHKRRRSDIFESYFGVRRMMTSADVQALEQAVLLVAGEERFRSSEGAGARRIADHVRHFLRLNGLTVLIGAGASFHLKAPSIRSMSATEIESLIKDGKATLQQNQIEVLKSLTDFPVNLEDLLQRLNAVIAYADAVSAQEVAIRNASVDINDICEIRKAINTALVRACDVSESINDPLLNAAHRHFFRKLLYSRRNLPHTRVFTTNYDLAIEYTLDETGADYVDGFKGTVRRSFHPEVYNQALYLSTIGVSQRILPMEYSLYYYKLHGSINWRLRSSKDHSAVVQQVYDPQTASDNDLALIYPTQDKEGTTLGYPYADLFRAFSDALLEPENGLLCIGYGFGDEHINRLINMALEGNPSLQLLIIEPSAIFSTANASEGRAPLNSGGPAVYAKRNDARISIVTGSHATFQGFAETIMPDLDVDETSLEAQPAGNVS